MPVANKEEELFAAYSVKNTRRANNARLFFLRPVQFIAELDASVHRYKSH